MPRADACALTYNAAMRLPLLRFCVILCGALLAAAFGGRVAAQSTPELRLAVASNFRLAAEALAPAFLADSGIELRVSSASTGVLAAQLRRGAPFDVLLAADRQRPQTLADDGFAVGQPQCYARGSLVLLGADEKSDSDAAITRALQSARRVAIANPRSAPYGQAAEAVLERIAYTGSESRRVIMGSNVLQAYQFFSSGAAEVALVARSLSPAAGLRIPGHWHPPVAQYLIVSAASPRQLEAQAFLAFLRAASTQDALQTLGYESCS